MRVLSFGGGVDSSAILAYHLLEADLGIEHVVFADTGAESKATYANIDFFKGLCADAGLPFSIVAKDGENIVEWVTRLGIVPVMPGGSHVCSKKYKGDVIQKWINQTFPNEQITYLIGIEANEGHRTARFTKPAGDTNEYEYPLVDMGMDRDACLELLAKHDITVVKSSCVFCPFMSVEEIRDIRNNDKEAWDLIKTVEHRFSEESGRKHQAWLDAGQPLNKGGRCNAGHWRKDSWAEGTRLFTKRVNGKQLSVEEWEELFDAEVEAEVEVEADAPELTFGSVCSGVEAASTAWEPIGFKPVFFSEIEEFPSAVLQHHWPDVPNHGNMEKFNEWGYTRGSIDVLVGGTPCQSFSIAGLRGGLGDARGNLSLTYMRMVDQLRPQWTVWENVPGVLSSNGGRDFGAIVGALAELGYSCAWRVLDAQNFGVPQRRRRVFLVGCATGDWRDPASVLFESNCGSRDFEASEEKKQDYTSQVERSVARMRGFGDYEIDGTVSTVKARDYKDATDLVIHANKVAPTITSSGPPYSRTGNQHSEVDALVVQSAVRRLTPTEAERLQGFPDGHTDIGWKGKPTPDSHRYKAMGNSMAVPVMRWIGERIQARELKRSCRADCELA